MPNLVLVDVCKFCGKTVEIDVDKDRWRQWQQGALLQDVMPELTPAEREFLISRICEECFDKL